MKVFKIVVISIVAIVLITTGGFYMKQEAEKQYMLEIAKSEEAREVYEKNITNLEKVAFTKLGKIQKYDIDYTSIKSNPMGGVMVTLIINDNPDYYMRVGLLYDDDTEKLRSPSTSYSHDLKKMIYSKGEYNG